MRVVAVLEVMWGRVAGVAPAWYSINPRNVSGRRLTGLIGSADFVVTNACRELVSSPREHPRPDAAWLRQNLAALDPGVVLVCGRVAQATFAADMVSEACAVVRMPHPAARTVTREEWAEYAAEVRAARTEALQEAFFRSSGSPGR